MSFESLNGVRPRRARLDPRIAITPTAGPVQVTISTDTYLWSPDRSLESTTEHIGGDAQYHHEKTVLTFTGTALNTESTGTEVVRWRWEFSDGTRLDGATVTHQYQVASPGAWVKLIVTDSRGVEATAKQYLNLLPL